MDESDSDRRSGASREQEAAEAEALALRARDGDRAAFEDLVLLYRDRVYRIAFRVVGNRDDALDVAQDVFIRLHAKLHTWDGRSRFFSWFYRLLQNVAIDHLRRRPRIVALANGADENVPDRSQPGGEAFEDREETEVLIARTRKAVDALPPQQKAILALRHYEGLSLQEIAELQGVALGTVKSTLFAAIRNLRRELGIDVNSTTFGNRP